MTDHHGTRVLFVQHQDDGPPGHVGDRMEQHGAEIDVVRAQAGRLPSPEDYDLIVPLGCYDSAYDDSLPYLAQEWTLLAGAVAADVPVFGICFGAQLLSRVLGGEVHASPDGPEVGWKEIETAPAAAGTVERGPWLVWHLDVMTTPPGGIELARTGWGTQAFRVGPHLGTQFHPEATVDGVLSWADHYRDLLPELGTGYDEMAAVTRGMAADAARRAYELTDRVLAQARRGRAGAGATAGERRTTGP
ncbi:MAG: type 1 glutamine amidotransferase [Actinomycetota bacterium]|nr:type 1 glutamine amidotransferase [Actinomycetota bacterium]